MLLHPSKKTVRHPRTQVFPGDLRLLALTVEGASVLPLRQLAARLCGDALQFTRVAACPDSRRVRVCLCIPKSLAEPVAAAVARCFADAVFDQTDGAFQPLPPRRH
ncbi:hypothetical protein [Janthinobacterium sp.]|uniref:hypothetical protein n=1 Tax=Janthinobacterium sp. TaxID=1871054 RepID=UPI00293D3061|nr:hypothetical protein [Janthinobacterium sp.]